tara:strand:+ start:718 stop:1032 length:315 start_codon:yes stop_codon:yes gene_type:complete
VEATTLESDITKELNKLVKLTRAMIKGNPAQMVELTSLDDDDICVDIATLLVDDDIFYFTDAKSEDPLDDYIEIRSHALPQMAISLPRPLFTRIKEQGWSEDLC